MNILGLFRRKFSNHSVHRSTSVSFAHLDDDCFGLLLGMWVDRGFCDALFVLCFTADLIDQIEQFVAKTIFSPFPLTFTWQYLPVLTDQVVSNNYIANALNQFTNITEAGIGILPLIDLDGDTITDHSSRQAKLQKRHFEKVGLSPGSRASEWIKWFVGFSYGFWACFSVRFRNLTQ